MSQRSKRACMFAAGLLASASAPALAAAQVAAGGSGDEAVIEEVIVTAQKRDERLQDVPVSISAFGEQALAAANIDSGTEIARLTPNLRVSVLGNENQPKFALRGISTSEFNLNAVSPTGVFYDEVYIGAQYLGGAGTYDIEQIEVLRGPQGTLFGKNTTAGAVHYRSHRPTFEHEARLTAGFGSHELRELGGVAELPLVAEKLTVRLAFDAAHSDGYVDSVNPAVSDRSNIDRASGRITLAYKDDEAGFKATLRYFHLESNGRAVGVINTGLGAGGRNALGRDPRVNPYTGQRMGNRETALDRNGQIEVRGNGGYLTLEKDLGWATLTSISSYVEGRFANNVDADGTIDNLLHIDFGAKNREIGQDIRIATNSDGPLNWIAGLYFFRDKIGIDTTYTIFGGPPILPILTQSYDQRRTSYAAYLDGTYKISDVFTLYGGIRYTDDKGRLSNFQVTPIIPVQPNLTYHDARPTGRLGLRAQVSEDVMIFGQFARGYRSSAFNGGALVNPADLNVADPESLDAWELGLKSQWFDRKLTFNASAFIYELKKQQFINLVGINNQQLVNAGKSQIKGLEIEVVARPIPRLSLNAGLGLLDAEYKRLVLNGVDFSGNDLIEAPPHNLNVGADYTLDLGEGGDLHLHADAANIGSQYYQASNTPLSRAGSFWDVNARIAWREAGGRYEVALYGKNLTDNDKPMGIVLDPTSQTRFATVPYPRRYGVELTARF